MLMDNLDIIFVVLKSFACFSNKVFVFLALICRNSLYIPAINSLSDVLLTPSPILNYHFSLDMASFNE